MANSVIIERVLDTYYDISLNGGVKIRDERPTMRGVGNECVFLSKTGANLIKKQKILYSEVTVIDTYGGTGTFSSFASMSALWLKLIEVKFIREEGSGSGATRFDELSDGFTYFGNDGKIPVVDEDMLKLVPRTFYNYKDLVQLDDVEIPSLTNGKILGVANVGGVNKVVQVNRPADGTTYFSAVGGFDYNDLATQTTPLAYTSGDLQLTNDTLGSYTFLSQPPYGVTRVWDEDTNTFDFSQLSIGDEVFLRLHINLTTTSANQISGLKVLFGEGTANEYEQPLDLGIAFKTAGSHDVLRELKFYIGNNDWRNTPAKLIFTSDASASIEVYGWHPYIIRKSINILDVQVKGGSEKPPYELATEGQTEILIDASADNVDVWINQVMQTETIDYNRLAGVVTMTYALSENDSIVHRTYTSESVKEIFTADELDTTVTLISSPRSVDVWVNGVYQIEDIAYTISGNIITFTYPLSDGDYITVRKHR